MNAVIPLAAATFWLLALAVRSYEHRVSIVVGNKEKKREQRETGQEARYRREPEFNYCS